MTRLIGRNNGKANAIPIKWKLSISLIQKQQRKAVQPKSHDLFSLVIVALVAI